MGTVTRPWIRLLILGGVVGGGYLLARSTGVLEVLGTRENWASLVGTIRAFTGRWWVGPAFALAYAGLVLFAVPASALTIIGGAAFGLVHGVAWVTVGANLGANLAFWAARRLGRVALEGLFGPRLGALDRVSGAAGFHGLLTLRLIPIVPFNLLNFAAALTTVPARDYALATLIGILPGTVVYVFFADALLAGSAEASRGALLRVLAAGALLVGFSLLSRRLLRRHQATGVAQVTPSE